MARALFSPFVVGALLRTGKAGSEEEARRMIRDRDNCAERELDQVASTRLVLLHRAPVLHRWGIQAFKPVLTEEEVLRLHPLTNVTFNADFDGDALEVFLPLSTSAQREAQEMRPTANQLGSADGTYIHGLSRRWCWVVIMRPGRPPKRSRWLRSPPQMRLQQPSTAETCLSMTLCG